MDSLAWLENWYSKQCDGDWEHGSGVQIDTLDNPGWSVNIDLQASHYDGVLNVVIIDKFSGESDWIICRIVDGRFEGRGDSQKLLAIIQKFRSWIDNF
jgi:hypothetical protein